MKYISRENHKIRIDEINYDFGVEDDTKILPEENKFVIRGIDLLEGLSGKERAVFSLFLRGYNTKILNKVYFNKEEKKNKKQKDSPIVIIEKQKEYLIKKYGDELLRQQRIYSSYNLDED